MRWEQHGCTLRRQTDLLMMRALAGGSRPLCRFTGSLGSPQAASDASTMQLQPSFAKQQSCMWQRAMTTVKNPSRKMAYCRPGGVRCSRYSARADLLPDSRHDVSVSPRKHQSLNEALARVFESTCWVPGSRRPTICRSLQRRRCPEALVKPCGCDGGAMAGASRMISKFAQIIHYNLFRIYTRVS
jgi:hypothetical protein